MNPSVEETEDETRVGASGFNAENRQLSWSNVSVKSDALWPLDFYFIWFLQICSRHESMIASHLEMLHSAKDVASDGDMLRTISSMLEKTNRLISQFNVVKKQMVRSLFSAFFLLFLSLRLLTCFDQTNSESRNHVNTSIQRERHLILDMNNNIGLGISGQNTPSRSASQPGDAKSTTTPGSSHSMQKKRARTGQDATDVATSSLETEQIQEGSSQKRKRLSLLLPGNDEDARSVTPISMETEDISEEVQRRLEIKEEQRKRRNSKPEKRKRNRDSLASNDSASSLGSTSRPKKRRREIGST